MKLIGNVQLVRGNSASIPAIMHLLEEHGFETVANPDIEIRVYPQLLVEDARKLCERTLTKSQSGMRRVFIVVTPNLTYEAQNTMLKTLEEPAGNALFFLVVPAPEMLIPTVRSRAQMLELDAVAQDERVDAELFLRATPQKRLDMLKPLLDKGEDDVRDISGVVTFLSSLERILARQKPISASGIEALYRARKYVGDKGSLLKTLLEQVALLVPVSK